MDPVEMMIEVIKENSPDSKWVGAPLEAFRSVANTNRGDIGEEFVRRYLVFHGTAVAKASARNQQWDMEIGGKRIEVKTASEDSGGHFQFNHIRLDRKYDLLLCLAVAPDWILFGLWGKGEVAEGKAGTLVRMAEGQSITFKLTRSKASLKSIDGLIGSLEQKMIH